MKRKRAVITAVAVFALISLVQPPLDMADKGAVHSFEGESPEDSAAHPVHLDSSSTSPKGGGRSGEKWTVLVYMSADNDLEDDAIKDINEMEAVGSSGDVDIIIQVDRNPLPPNSNGGWDDTRRYRIDRDSDPYLINSTRLDDPEHLGELDMADPEVLRDFLTWGLSSYPADRYLVVIWGHANGCAGGICTDDTTHTRLDLDEFGSVFRDVVDTALGSPVDVVAFDQCWMGLIEVAAEVMDHAEYMVGSFDEEPAAGWPYDIVLQHILDREKPLVDRLSDVVDGFLSIFDLEDSQSYASQAAVDLAVFREDFIPAWKALSEEMFYTAYDESELYQSLMPLADRTKKKEELIDAYHLVEMISNAPGTPPRVRWAARQVAATEEGVIIHSGGGSFHKPQSRFFGVYHPSASSYIDSGYPDLILSGETAWDDYLFMAGSGMDARPWRLNWTHDSPDRLDFRMESSTPSRISNVFIQLMIGSVEEEFELVISDGVFSGHFNPSGSDDILYRYLIITDLGRAIHFPPDGYELFRSGEDGETPEIWHEPPVVVESDKAGGGLMFMIRDRAGVDISNGVLSCREVGKESWYRIPLSTLGIDLFRGWISVTGASSLGITPCGEFEYYLSVPDSNGNEGRSPKEGVWKAVMGSGAHFLLDVLHSDLGGYERLLDGFNASGLIVSRSEMDLAEVSWAGYKGYVLLEPRSPLSWEGVNSLLAFHRKGGEILLVLDPKDPSQTDAVSMLLDELGVEYSPQGSASDLLPTNPSSPLGPGLPTIVGPWSGSLMAVKNAIPAYFTSPPLAALLSGMYDMGKFIVAVPIFFKGDVLSYSTNMDLMGRVISHLMSNDEPTLSYTVSPTGVVEAGTEVVFNMTGSHDTDGIIVGYSAIISDGTLIEGADPVIVHRFLMSGQYNVILEVKDAEGGESSATIPIIVNRAPELGVGVSGYTVHAGEDVTFRYLGEDPDGDDVIVQWDFGDGSGQVGQKVVKHAYSCRGKYNVSMIVRDDLGLESRWEGVIVVINSDPVARIDRDEILVNSLPAVFTGPAKVTILVREGDRISLSAKGSGDADMGDVLIYNWSMGDGKAYSGIGISHAYYGSGPMNLNLTVSDGYGGYDHEELFILVVNRPPSARFSSESLEGGVVDFDASESGDDPWDLANLTYAWDFGDGETLETDERSVSHEYAWGGTYKVNLTVRDGDGDEGYFEMDVEAGGMTIVGLLALISITVVVLALAGILFALLYRRSKGRMEEGGESPTRGGFDAYGDRGPDRSGAPWIERRGPNRTDASYRGRTGEFSGMKRRRSISLTEGIRPEGRRGKG